MNKIWVVKDPSLTAHSVLSEFMFEITPGGLARYITGTGIERYEAERHTLHLTEEDAKSEILRRLDRMHAVLQSVISQLRPRDSEHHLVEAWANLRSKAGLDEVVDMVRQDLEAEVPNTDDAQRLAQALMASIHSTLQSA